MKRTAPAHMYVALDDAELTLLDELFPFREGETITVGGDHYVVDARHLDMSRRPVISVRRIRQFKTRPHGRLLKTRLRINPNLPWRKVK